MEHVMGFKMRLVKDWRKAWTWFSVQSMAVSTTLLAAWAALPDDLKGGIPPRVVTGVAAGVLALGIAGRLVQQGKKKTRSRRQ